MLEGAWRQRPGGGAPASCPASGGASAGPASTAARSQTKSTATHKCCTPVSSLTSPPSSSTVPPLTFSSAGPLSRVSTINCDVSPAI
ncbi:unnamed protein product [Urochloa humidicola]